VRVDLNADLGEEVTDDAALLAVVSSANVACGYHAGTPAIMRAVCSEAAERGVSVGAQVSYDDRANFGRVARDVARAVLREQVADQVGLLSGIAAEAGTAVRYLKPHGALYHRVLDDDAQAAALVAAVRAWDPSASVLTQPDGRLAALAADAGLRVVAEAFADRGYGDDGRLLPRALPGALLTDPEHAAAQAVRLAATGRFGSLCVHGDTPGAPAIAAAVRSALADAAIDITAFALDDGR
jgi:UPF0271 protein